MLMFTLDFERITAEKLGGVAWVLDSVEERLRETGRLDGEAARRLSRLRGELQAARLLSFRAADALDRGLPASADLSDGEAGRGAARAAGGRCRGRPARARRAR